MAGAVEVTGTVKSEIVMVELGLRWPLKHLYVAVGPATQIADSLERLKEEFMPQVEAA